MENANDLVNKTSIHLTTNTILLILVALVAFYILIKAIGGLIKTIALVVVCWFVLMTLQSTNLVNVPLIKETYNKIENKIPSKELWTEAIDGANKINKSINDGK